MVEQPPARRDRELTDWSVENDLQYAAFLDAWRAHTAGPSKTYRPRAIAAPLYQAVTRLQAVREGTAKKAELEGAVDTFLDVYALSQHALRLPRLERPLPAGLPEGLERDAQKVGLGNDAKGTFVGLVSKRQGRGGKAP